MPRTCALACLIATAAAALPAGASGIVANGEFDAGGHTYADRWRPLPGSFRMHRRGGSTGDHSLYLQLRADGDGGVVQVVDLPPGRRLSLRVLATCWANGNDAVVAGLIRRGDGLVLAEIVVDGIKRGEMAADFETVPGGAAELMLRLVGDKGARASIERVTIGPPIETRVVGRPVFSTSRDLVLGPGDGLRIDADFAPRLLPAAAEMLQEALEDITGHATERVAATVSVSVPQPESTDWPARESYHLTVRDSGVTIEAPAEQGAFWAMMTLIDLIRAEPAGGVRILVVDVHDWPALPWRIGVEPDLMFGPDPVSGARRLARLKLNMALVAYGPEGPLARGSGRRQVDSAQTMGESWRYGMAPLVWVMANAESYDPSAALRDAVERLRARYLLLWYPAGSVPDWQSEPLTTALALAGDGAGQVIVLLEESVPLAGPPPGRLGEVLHQAVADWPTEVVFAMPSGLPPDAQAGLAERLGARGVPWVADLTGPSAGTTQIGQPGCAGAVVTGQNMEQAADLAWRGLPEEMR